MRLTPGINHPVRAGSDLATIWQQLPATGPAPTTGDLDELIRRWHALPPPEQPLREFDPLADVHARLDAADALDEDDRRFLRDRCDELAAALTDQDWELPPGPIHGDAHTGNLIPSPVGPMLCDFDSACTGPREWDLVPTVFGATRFAEPAEKIDRFLTAYGRDVSRSTGFALLLRIRELKLATSVTPLLNTNPDVREEFAHRLRSLRDGDTAIRWHRYT